MEPMDVEPARNEPTGFIQTCRRWRENFRNLPRTKKIIYVGLLIFALVSPFVIYFCWPSKNSKENVNKPDWELDGGVVETLSQGKVCITAGCVQTAASILKNMDAAVKPCENFYQFACGKFVKESAIPEARSEVSTLLEASTKLDQQLRISLEQKIMKYSSRTFELLRTYYNVCLDTEQIEKTSTDDVLNILNELGGWPVMIGQSWSSSNFDWTNFTYQVRKLGYLASMNALIAFNIEVDEVNNDRFMITLDQASTGIKNEYLTKGLNERVVQAYYKYIVNLAEILGANRQLAEKELAESLNFEIELAKISLSAENRNNRTQLYNPMTIQQLESEYPYISWLEHLNKICAPLIQLKLDDRVIVRVPSFMKSFSKLIDNTPKRVIANYALGRVVQTSAYFMNASVKRIEAEFLASMTGTKHQEPRWADCVDYVAEVLQPATGSLYIREYFNENSKTIAKELVSGLQKSLAGLLDKVDWMDEKTKKAAEKKLNLMQKNVAYADELLDDNILDEYYQSLEAHPGSFLKSNLNLQLFNMKKNMLDLKKTIDKFHWTLHANAAVVNAFHHPQLNSIEIPAAILQDAFFASNRPNYMNYGAIGWVIGHELTHGFDVLGSQFDSEGKLRDWWDPETQEEYRKRAECFINQYSNYTVKDLNLNLNGNTTQGENIADSGGIKEAYVAYEEYERQNGEEPRLPGLPYTPRQLFWISAANTWCGKLRPEAMRNDIISGVHTINEFRVVGPFSNMPQFSNDFECPVGSPMNPIKKCTIW